MNNEEETRIPTEIGIREFTVGQKVRIIRRETWQGDICTITRQSKRNPTMYWLKEHGWRRCDEIELVEETPPPSGASPTQERNSS